DPHAARHIARTRDDLLRSSGTVTRASRPPERFDGSMHNWQSTAGGTPALRQGGIADRDTLLLKLPLLAYPDRVVRRRANNPNAGVMVGGSGVQMGGESIVRQGEFFIALDAWHNPHNPAQEATIRLASLIEPAWLHELFPQQIRRINDVTYDAAADRVIPRLQVLYRDLLLEEDRHGRLDPQLAAAALIAAARPRIVEIFATHKTGGAGGAGNLLARVALLRKAMPEHTPPWPTLDAEQLSDALAQSNILQGKRSLAELQDAPLADVVRSLLPYPLDRQLDELAPESITVPTGNHIRIDYTADPPVLAVRLQEMFGQTDTPRIAAGRVPLLLHLLAPNYRPVQITTDLRSFWANAYFQTRKDLRIRYPKHAWPEDPLTAPPVAKGRPRKT
ncbi:MAG: ATP-dependent helicase C-terminal domain-containing protein, partial [Phycisphaerae bacterium]